MADDTFDIGKQSAEAIRQAYNLGLANGVEQLGKEYNAGVENRINNAITQMLNIKQVQLRSVEINDKYEMAKDANKLAWAQFREEARFRYRDLDARNRIEMFKAGLQVTIADDRMRFEDAQLTRELENRWNEAKLRSETQIKEANIRASTEIRINNDRLRNDRLKESMPRIDELYSRYATNAFRDEDGNITQESITAAATARAERDGITVEDALYRIANDAASLAFTDAQSDPLTREFAEVVTPEKMLQIVYGTLGGRSDVISQVRSRIATEMVAKQNAYRQLDAEAMERSMEGGTSLSGILISDGQVAGGEIIDMFIGEIDSIERDGAPLSHANKHRIAAELIGSELGLSQQDAARAADEILIGAALRNPRRFTPLSDAALDYLGKVRADIAAQEASGEMAQAPVIPEAVTTAVVASQQAAKDAQLYRRAEAAVARKGDDITELKEVRDLLMQSKESGVAGADKEAVVKMLDKEIANRLVSPMDVFVRGVSSANRALQSDLNPVANIAEGATSAGRFARRVLTVQPGSPPPEPAPTPTTPPMSDNNAE